MKKIAYVAGLVLLTLGTQTMADELDDLMGDIKIVDESAKSDLFQREKIVGCSDFAKQKELTCSKKPKEAILSKLPSSQQLEETDLDSDEAREDMKTQLSSILAELKKLRKEQQADRATIEQLKGIISTLSEKKTKSSPKKMLIVKKELTEMVPKQKKSQSKTATLIRKKIKEISRDETSAVIEVQSNESLSTYAQAYYNDNRKYHKIYNANKDKIPASMIIMIGDRLTIPLD